MPKTTKEIVYEDIITCLHCGFKRQVKSGGYDHTWNFGHVCEVCKGEGCSNCMMHFEERDKYFYHDSCSSVLPSPKVSNRPYFSKKHAMSKKDIIPSHKYIFHCEGEEDKHITVLFWEHVQFHGDLLHFKTEDGKEDILWPPKIGIESEAANFEDWNRNWLEKKQDDKN